MLRLLFSRLRGLGNFGIRKGKIMPSIAQLERFVESARLGSFSAAASKLYLAPQTVSKSVHELERELGADLFKPVCIRLPLPRWVSWFLRMLLTLLVGFRR